MPAAKDINSRIALVKGWRLDTRQYQWISPEGERRSRPDYVGTLEGVAGMMRELQARRKPGSQWAWYWNEWKQRFVMRHSAWRRSLFRRQVHAVFYSDIDHPGDCVGEAWLSMFEKEGADAGTE